MDTVIRVVLWIHVLAGTVALLMAPGALLTVKGGPAHRRWGKIYFWAMTVVAVTALGVGYWRLRVFLVLVAVFSFYAALSGYRVLYRKRPELGQGATTFDWIAAVLTLLASSALVVMGILRPSPTWQRLGVVAIVLGIVGLFLAVRDILAFVRPPTDRNAWWYHHMTSMIASYIAVEDPLQPPEGRHPARLAALDALASDLGEGPRPRASRGGHESREYGSAVLRNWP